MPDVVPSTWTSFTQRVRRVRDVDAARVLPRVPAGAAPLHGRLSMPAHFVGAAPTRETCACCAVVNVQWSGVVSVSVLPDTPAISTRSLAP